MRKLTGADIEIPSAPERVVAHLGPGPAREIVAELLNGSRFNYVLLGSPSDDSALTRVVLVAKTGPQEMTPNPVVAGAPPPALPNPGVGQPEPEAAPEENEAEADENNNGDDANADQQPAEAEQQPPQDQPQGIKTPQQMLQEMQQRQMQMQQQHPEQPPVPGPGSGMPPHPPQEELGRGVPEFPRLIVDFRG